MRWRTIAPISPEYQNREGIGTVYDLGLGISLGPRASWPVDPTVLPSLGDVYRREIEESGLFMVAEYDAEAMGDPSDVPGFTKQALSFRRLREAALALWILRPSRLCFRLGVYHVESEEGLWLHRGHEIFCLSFLALERYRHARLVRRDVLASAELFGALATILHDGPVWVACRCLFGALQETDPSLRFLLHWIGLEALFGAPNRSRGVGDTLTVRAGAFLQTVGETARQIRRALSRSYEYRHAISHGMRLAGLPSDPEQLILPVEGAMRGALHKILTDSALVSVFNGSTREEYLDSLARSGRP